MIHIGSNIVINCSKPNLPNKKYNLTSEIKRMFENNDPIRRPQLSFISKYIGKNWRNLGRILGYLEGQMDQFEINEEVHGVDEVIIWSKSCFLKFIDFGNYSIYATHSCRKIHCKTNTNTKNEQLYEIKYL